MKHSIPPTGWGDVVTRADLTANAVLLRGEMAETRAEFASLDPGPPAAAGLSLRGSVRR